WDRVVDEKNIFLKALEIESPEEQVEFLDQACGNDADLRSNVESLLQEYDTNEGFLETPYLGSPENPPATQAESDETDMNQDSDSDEVPLDFLTVSNQPGSLGRLGIYEVLEVLGRGGMGVVLKAQDTKLNRIVAVKVLAPEYSAHVTARQRFLREAQAAAAITHSHVVTIYAVDEEHEIPYLAMECIDGKTLQQKIESQGTLDLLEILRIGSQIALGLAAAHAQGLVHRDVNPANILLENGIERAMITDFGLARAIDDVAITKAGEVIGTPLFMSPEQARGDKLDHRSDLFSLGSILYSMCTGRAAFRAESSIATLRRVCDDAPRPIREVNSEIPQWLEEIIQRLMEKSRDERFQTAHEIADLLERHLAHLQSPSDAQPPGPLSKTETKAKPRRFGRWLAAGVLLLVVGMLAVGLTESTGTTNLTATVMRFFRPKTDVTIIDKEHSLVNQEHTEDISPPENRDTQSAQPLFTPTEILTSDESEWTKPVNLGPNVNSEHFEGAPELSTDGLTLIFVSDRPGGEGGLDLWMSTRDSVDAPWSTAVNLGPTVNGTKNDTGPSLATDGLTLIYDSSRPGGQGHWDLWRCTRSSRNDSWSEPVNLGYELNARTSERSPTLSADGLTLLFSAARAGGPSSDLAISRRASRQDAWSRPIRLSSEINSESADGGPALSADGLTLIFHSTRPGGSGSSDLWLSSRTSATEAWSEPINLGEIVNTTGNDGNPTLSADGRTLIFEGGRPGTIGGHDLWMSRRVWVNSVEAMEAEIRRLSSEIERLPDKIDHYQERAKLDN
ncbi:MAG: protein kinase, partial [Rhodothermia bacterium]